MKKKVLLVYPHNFFEEKSGINSRFLELLRYFRAVNAKVDLLALKNFKSSWENCETDKRDLVQELFFYDFKKGARWQSPNNRKQNPLVWLKKHIPFCHAYTALPDFAYSGMKKYFCEILRQNHYDFVIISYVYWAGLLSAITGGGRTGITGINDITTVLDLSDFITLNRFDSSGGNVKIGPMIEEEIRRVNFFDKVMCISADEKTFFSQFATRPEYHYIPYFMDKNVGPKNEHRQYDIMFIGSDNPHNQKGMQWFFEKIYPYLSNSLRILIVGSITPYVPAFPNVTRIPVVEKITDLYPQAKMAICPLLGGTGMKIKVVEALSFGLPVVTTTKGVTGFPAKVQNGCLIADTPEKFARTIEHLLGDPNFYHRQQEYAEDFFMENFEKSTVYRHLDEIFAADINKMDTQILPVNN